MAPKEKELLDTTEEPKRKKKIKRQFPLKKILLVFFILLIISGGGAAGYFFYFAEKPGYIEKSGLGKNILIFTFEQMPLVHAGLKSINSEIIITEKEIDRINEIEKTYPDQEKITGSERKIWEKNLKTLTKFLEKHEKEIKTIYVAYQVNGENGQKLIEEKKETMAKESTEVVTPSKVLTDKIRAIEEAKGFFDKTKDMIFK